MKRLLAGISIVICLVMSARGGDQDYLVAQGSVMECSPPKFLLVSDVDLDAQTLTGLFTVEIAEQDKRAVGAFHRTLRLSDIEVTNARRKPIEKNEYKKLEGELVVVSEGITPLGAVYLGLFREDTYVITIKH